MAISNSRRSKSKVIKTAIRVRVKPSVKAMAEQLAQKDGRSIADWLERLIAAEKARRSKKP
jgi:predicted HicB family RNase H-like nuclease